MSPATTALLCGLSTIMTKLADADIVDSSPYRVIAVTLYRELQTPDVREDHKLMLTVIRNRANARGMTLPAVCLERWQFSYWNRFWQDGQSTVTAKLLATEFAKVPESFRAELTKIVFSTIAVTESSGINHFYSPASMRSKFSEPGWARGKTPVFVTKRFRYYAL